MEAITIANKMIATYRKNQDLEAAYSHLDGLSYALQTESGRTRQQALNLFHAWLDLEMEVRTV